MRMMSRFESTVWLLPVALMVVLVGGPAAAQDIKGDKELTEHAQKIDKTADRAAPEKVVDKIAAQFSGDQFACDNKFVACGGSALGTKKTLTSSQVESLVKTLRTGSASGTKGLGFGEISILLALAAKQTSANPKSVSDILAMRQAGDGWGEMARDLGYKNLGSVLKSVKAAEKGVNRVAQADDKHPDKVGKAATVEKIEKPARVERPERPERPGR